MAGCAGHGPWSLIFYFRRDLIMRKTVLKFLFAALLLVPYIVAAADNLPQIYTPMDPAPADRPTYHYSREPGQLKHDKYGMIDPTPDVISLKYLPLDKYGFVDWMKALDDGTIAPRDAVPGNEPVVDPKVEPDNILIKARQDFMPDVIFPHSAHEKWLKCGICHPKIFAEKAGKTPITMVGIWRGQFCGRCHDKVAFPTRNCFRCHSAPKQYKKTGEAEPPKDTGKWSSKDDFRGRRKPRD